MEKRSSNYKHRLQDKCGSLRKASMQLRINYFRLSQIVNGWVLPHPEELTRIELLLRKNAKKKRGST